MCRLAAFPPGTHKEFANEVLADFVRGNDDGVGSAYVKSGEFILKKFPYSYQEAVTKKDDLFDHMPYNGWTIAHVRYATHGGNTLANTHPIIRGDLVGVHNGVFSGSGIIRLALDGAVKWAGETDSEVALYLLNKLGRDKFYKEMPSGAGVYLTLNRKGELDCTKLSGDLRFLKMSNGSYSVASAFPTKYRDTFVTTGGWGFKPDGTPRDWSEESEKKKTDRYSQQDIGYGKGIFWYGGKRYNSTDEDYCTGSEGGCHVPPPTHSEVSTPLVIIPGGKEEEKKPSQPSLWDWKDDQEIIDYVREMI